MATLTLAQKAPALPYGPLLYAAWLQDQSTDLTITVTWKDAALVKDNDKSSTTVLTMGDNEFVGPCAAIRELAALSGHASGHADQAAAVERWLAAAQSELSTSDFKQLGASLAQLNHHLVFRSFLAGYALTEADFAVWGALRSSRVFQSNLKSGTAAKLGVHLVRWYNYVNTLPQAEAALQALQKAVESTRNRVDQGNFDIPLKDGVQGGVVTRFPPEPSGYLHIGHAKAALLNQYFAQKYNGRLIIRFDDTNPSKEKMEYEESIVEDLKLLGITSEKITHTSDYFDQLYEYALELIRKGLAYVDDTDNLTMREERGAGIESRCRNNSMEENLKRFAEMTEGTEYGLKCCLRAKMSVDNPNKAMRDPVIYRCNIDAPHHIHGRKWKVYPTYDFACPVVDSLEGVTHALRTNEYRDRNPQYEWFFDALGIRKVHIWDFSRLNFVYTLLSKRKLQAIVGEGLVTGWDDPRFPTVRGIRRRGLTIEALKQYIIMQGASQNILLLEWDKLWALNKKVIDPVAPRHTAITEKDLCVANVLDCPALPHAKDVPKHKKNPAVGTKKVYTSSTLCLDAEDAAALEVGEEVTLMDWGNMIVRRIQRDETSGVVQVVDLEMHLEGDFKKTKKKLTWLSMLTPAEEPGLIQCVLLDYDYLITKKKLEENDDWKDFITPVTEFKVPALGDSNLHALKQGDIIQLERRGYYICDKPSTPESPAVHLIRIPDGKATSMATKSGKA
ncbi:tRNA synthetases class I, catalytic domain-containing protein [Dimargaris cristalligena]|uniref:Probable glutamate--tRNA ligase, cytoplasmic n=1 Tax=Dimargaris cristalligena TaxID=215637 RepID=A0A4V1J4P7_9FUNG|nr:tRNA synthetases class I, catalytic domain-containing protein [Dimargaris cristalligena]|eukprot:RKP36299.1 tRNA synthetases class I, catalytic domain-containing protein [Dimargaris cristalligena]